MGVIGTLECLDDWRDEITSGYYFDDGDFSIAFMRYFRLLATSLSPSSISAAKNTDGWLMYAYGLL